MTGTFEQYEIHGQLAVLENKLEDAHLILDSLGVPRKDAVGQTFTVAGRIEWLRDTYPAIWDYLGQKILEGSTDGR